MQAAPPETVERSRPQARAHAHHDRTFGLRFGRIAGVELYVDWSVTIIFALVAIGLGAGVLPRWHPNWSEPLKWAVAFAAALAFFASILLHELSHALVGRAYGIAVPRITLFVFGGLAHLQGEPKTPKAELLMAVVGPITSLVIGFAASFLGVALMNSSAARGVEPEAMIESAGPVATLFLWLGPINIVLGVFNLVPGFPLDGGRVLRALIWWQTGDMEKATHWASDAGRAVGAGLMVIGVVMIFGFRVPIFGTGLGSGIWIALIGWFLHNAARASYAELRVRRRLEHVCVRDMMRAGLDTVPPNITIAELVSEHVMRSDQTSFPVLDDSQLVGTISTRDVQRVPSDRWPYVTVSDIMTPAEEVPSIDPEAKAVKALETLAEQDVDQLPVVDHGQLRGFVRRQDILKWLTLQPDLTA